MSEKNYDQFIARIHYHGCEFRKVKNLINEFVKRYNEISKEINKNLEKWNDACEEKYNCFPMKEMSHEWMCYGQYIAAHYMMICVENNFTNSESRIRMESFCDNTGEPLVVGIVDNDREKYFHVEILGPT